LSNSYSEYLQLSCSDCKQTFTSAIWLIVDVEERPDLLETTLQGHLHVVACPHCGSHRMTEAPLLLYRPGRQPAILYCPIRQILTTEDQQQAQQLLDHLKASLGDAWQEVWLDQAVLISPQKLPAVLNDEAVSDVFPQTENSSILSEYREYLYQVKESEQRYLRDGRSEDLDSAVQAWERVMAHPEFESAPVDFRMSAMQDAGGVYLTRYWLKEREEDLERALLLLQSAVAGILPDSSDFVHGLYVLSLGLEARYRRAKAFPDLEESIRLLTQAAVLVDPGSPDLPEYLHKLGTSLRYKYGHTKARSDLDEAIRSLTRAVELVPQDSPDLPGVLDDLGFGFRDLYRLTKALPDLDEAIRAYTRAVDLVPSQSNDLPGYLNNLGNRLLDRYSLTGTLSDLEQAIQVCRRAVDLTPLASPDLPLYLNNLGNGLIERYQRAGAVADLNESISLWERAVAFRSQDASFLNNLGNGLHRRYQRTGDVADLKEAVHVHRGSVERTPPDAPELPGHLNNLGNALRDLYCFTGEPAHLEQSIALARRSVELASSNPVDLPSCFNSLGSGLSERYLRSGASADLEEAIHLFEQAVATTPSNSYELPARLNNLAHGLNARYLCTGALTDLDESIRLYRKVVELTPSDSLDLPGRLNNLGTGLSRRHQRMGEIPDLDEALDAFRTAVEHALPDSRDLPAYLINLSAGLSTRSSRTGTLLELEESIHVARRALELVPAEVPDRSLCLDALASGLRDRYSKGKAFPDLEESIRFARQAAAQAPLRSPVRFDYLYNLTIGLRLLYYHRQDQSEDATATLAEAVACYRQISAGESCPLETILRCSRAWGNWALERRSWEEACEAYRYGMQASRALFQAQVSRAAKESWLKETHQLYARAAYALARSGNLPEALEAIEAGQARLLAESLEQNRRDLDRLPLLGQAELLERYRTASERYRALASQQALTGLEKADSRPADWLQQLTAAQADIQITIEKIQQVPGYEDFLLPSTAIQIRLLSEQMPLVYLALTPVGGMALIVHGEQMQVVWLDVTESDLNGSLTRGEDNSPADHYLGGIMGIARLEPALDRMLTWLGGKVVGPVAETLAGLPACSSLPGGNAGNMPICLIPSGRLILLPLHAARYRRDGQEQTLIDTFTVHYCSSARVLSHAIQAQERVGNSISFLGIGNPLPLPDGIASLAFACPEVEEIASMFSTHNTLYETDATLSAVRQILPVSGYIHFSCHGMFDFQEPLLSGVGLANGELLTLAELLDGNLLQLRLVVLSACQTAIMDFSKLPEEAIGLPAGFLQAGAPGVVGSLWKVNDLSTALLMVRFYQFYLKDSISPANALRRAQRWLQKATYEELYDTIKRYSQPSDPSGKVSQSIQDVRRRFRDYALNTPDQVPFSHPYFWAGFVFSGV
jgi:CHAT domain-containing protein/tetratricopeptide (TPR) repeat protein